MEHPINDLFKISMETLQDMIDVNTVVGEINQINDEVSVIPISKVKCSYVTGGMDQKKAVRENNEYPFGGATGGMVTISPVAFLVVSDGNVNILHLEENTHLYEKIIDTSLDIASEIKKMIKKN